MCGFCYTIPMFYFFHGTDTSKSRAKMHAVLEGAQKKRPDAEVFKMDAEHFSVGELDGLIGGMGLFEKKYIVVLDRIFENKENIPLLVGKIKSLAETENLFLILEGKVDAKTSTKLEASAFKTETFDLPKEGRKFGMAEGALSLRDFNIFSISDAFAAKDRKALWVLFERAKRFGIPAEEISGVLFWQLKAIMIAKDSGKENDAGFSPFVLGKAKAFAKKWNHEELLNFSSKLVSVYHEAHRGICDFDCGLERAILSLTDVRK